MDSFTISFETLEGFLRAGRLREARLKLKEIGIRRIPRGHYLRFCQFTYRLNLPSLGLSLFRPLIFSRRGAMDSLSPEELAEYSMLLVRIGATNEAVSWLSKVDPIRVPQCLLYRAFVSIAKWDYSNAQVWLERYLSTSGVDAYQSLIARTNLAACYLNCQNYTKARDLLTKLSNDTIKQGALLLYGNVLEMQIQFFIFTGNYTMARRTLKAAGAMLPGLQSVDSLYVRKWGAILKLFSAGPKTQALESLLSVRNDAIMLSYWETMRDCDFHQSWACRDRKLFEHVYFGTPYFTYRKRMEEVVSEFADLPDSYRWREKELLQPNACFDLIEGIDRQRNASLKRGYLLHLLLMHLCSDFYKPFRVGTLFSNLFPGEHFDPNSSPLRVQQLVHRLRKWFAENEIPLGISGKNSGFRIRFCGRYAISVPREIQYNNFYHNYITKLRSSNLAEPFTSSQAAKHLNVSKRLVNKIISVDGGENFTRIGQGCRTRYQLKAT